MILRANNSLQCRVYSIEFARGYWGNLHLIVFHKNGTRFIGYYTEFYEDAIADFSEI